MEKKWPPFFFPSLRNRQHQISADRSSGQFAESHFQGFPISFTWVWTRWGKLSLIRRYIQVEKEYNIFPLSVIWLLEYFFFSAVPLFLCLTFSHLLRGPHLLTYTSEKMGQFPRFFLTISKKGERRACVWVRLSSPYIPPAPHPQCLLALRTHRFLFECGEREKELYA